MASCLRNIRTKNYRSLLIGLQVTVENVGNAFFGTQCRKFWPITRTQAWRHILYLL